MPKNSSDMHMMNPDEDHQEYTNILMNSQEHNNILMFKMFTQIFK